MCASMHIDYLGCEVLRPTCLGYLNDPPGTELLLSVNVHDRLRLQNVSAMHVRQRKVGQGASRNCVKHHNRCLLSAFAAVACTLQHNSVYQVNL